MVYLLYGNEPFRIKYQLSKLATGYNVMQADSITEDVKEFLSVSGIMGSPCVVYRTGSLGADEKLLKLAQKHERGRGLLVIVAQTVKENTKLFAFLKKSATIVKCDKLAERELIAHIVRGVKNCGCEITESACMSLIERSGYMTDDDISLYAVNNFIKQLSHCGAAVQKEDVEALVKPVASEDSRTLISLLCSGNGTAFMTKVLELVEVSDMIMLTGSLIRSFRIAYKASLIPGADSKELSKALGLNSYQMRYIQPLFKADGQTISDCLEVLTKGSGELKSSIVPQRTVFLTMMGYLCGKFSRM